LKSWLIHSVTIFGSPTVTGEPASYVTTPQRILGIRQLANDPEVQEGSKNKGTTLCYWILAKIAKYLEGL